MKLSIFSLALMGAVFVPVLSMAGPGGLMVAAERYDMDHGAQMGMHAGMMKTMLKEKIGLNDKQIDSIQKIKYKADRARIDIEYKIKKERLHLRKMMEMDKPAKAKILSQIDKLGILNTQVKKNRIGLMLDIRALMTEQQWTKMEQLHQANRQKRKHKRMRRRRGHMGQGAPMDMDMNSDSLPGP